MRRIGIDFGTCNIKGAEKKKNGDITYIKLGKAIDKPRIPNVILYEMKDGNRNCCIGETALKKPASEQDKVRNIKAYLQEEKWNRKLSFGEIVNVYDVTFDIMKILYEEIHNTNKNEEISATITVPVNFSKRQQQIVEKAAKNAGFIVDAVITEPFASVFYLMKDYLDDIDEEEKRDILVFDFGGGTLDLCLVEIKNQKGKIRIETQATVGISYGGNNINDDILENILRKKEPEKVHNALNEQDNILRQAVNRYFIMDAINTMKAELFEEEDIDEDYSSEVIPRLYDGSPVDFGKVSISEIYHMFDEQRWNQRIENLLNQLFDDSDTLIPLDVTDVFMVGGTSSIPYFRNIITEYFKKNKHQGIENLFELNDDMDSEDRIYTSVSAGAAIYNELIDENEIEIRDKIPFLVYSKNEQGKQCTKISLDACFEDAPSPLAPITDEMKADKKIGVYQTIFGEKEKEVFLDYIYLDDEIVANATLYRLKVDKKRNIQMEFGYLIDESEDLESVFCRDWCLDLEVYF